MFVLRHSMKPKVCAKFYWFGCGLLLNYNSVSFYLYFSNKANVQLVLQLFLHSGNHSVQQFFTNQNKVTDVGFLEFHAPFQVGALFPIFWF